jgi:hypothetical protein
VAEVYYLGSYHRRTLRTCNSATTALAGVRARLLIRGGNMSHRASSCVSGLSVVSCMLLVLILALGAVVVQTRPAEAGDTHVGTNVSVTDSLQGVTITFSEVTAEGNSDAQWVQCGSHMGAGTGVRLSVLGLGQAYANAWFGKNAQGIGWQTGSSTHSTNMGYIFYHGDLLLYPVTVGKSWDLGRMYLNEGYVEGVAVIENLTEAVSVPAGTFDCVRVSKTFSYSRTPYLGEITSQQLWLAPGVGPVKSRNILYGGTVATGELSTYSLSSPLPDDYFPAAVGDRWQFHWDYPSINETYEVTETWNYPYWGNWCVCGPIDVFTTAAYVGPVTLDVRYSIPSWQTYVLEEDLTVLQWDGAGWTDVTTSVDVVNHIIHAETDLPLSVSVVLIPNNPNAPSNQPPLQPTNDLPLNGATGIGLMPTLQSLAFSDPNVEDTQAASYWQITSTPGDYSTPVLGVSSTTSLDTFSVPSGSLNYATPYYWHVRYRDNHGAWSDWSTETQFTTAVYTPNPPTVITSPASSVFATSAIGHGYLDSMGGASSVLVSFEGATDEFYVNNGNTYQAESYPTATMTTTGPFSFCATGLLPNTTYHFRAKAVGDGIAYGSDLTFTTAGVGGDGDGVPADVEDAAPNYGDGNNDGVLDSVQSDVSSFPNAANGGYVTLESPSGTNLVGVAPVGESSLPSQGKPNLQFAHGFFQFEIRGLTDGESVTLTIILPYDLPAGSQYWKYGPTPDNHSPHWYQISMGSNDGDNVITIALKDGGLGDDDLTANGVIVDQGGPGWPGPSGPSGGGTRHAPAFPDVYIGIGAALGAGILAYFARRRLAHP